MIRLRPTCLFMAMAAWLLPASALAQQAQQAAPAPAEGSPAGIAEDPTEDDSEGRVRHFTHVVVPLCREIFASQGAVLSNNAQLANFGYAVDEIASRILTQSKIGSAARTWVLTSSSGAGIRSITILSSDDDAARIRTCGVTTTHKEEFTPILERYFQQYLNRDLRAWFTDDAKIEPPELRLMTVDFDDGGTPASLDFVIINSGTPENPNYLLYIEPEQTER